MTRSSRWLQMVVCLLAVLLISNGAAAQAKKRFKPKGDKKDDIVGAIWSWEAKDAKTGTVKQGTFRVADYVIYDTKAGGVMGKIMPKGKESADLLLAKPFDLPGTCSIAHTSINKKKGITIWQGMLKSGAAEWNLTLQMIDQ